MIKLFEEYNQYYTEISEEEFFRTCGDTHYTDDINVQKNMTLVFSDDEINFLRVEIKGNFHLSNNIRYKSGRYTYVSFIKDSDSERVYIYKLPDEWYMAEVDFKYYKCDQLEGLVKCINDL